MVRFLRLEIGVVLKLKCLILFQESITSFGLHSINVYVVYTISTLIGSVQHGCWPCWSSACCWIDDIQNHCNAHCLFFQSCLVGILVPDPDVLPRHCREKLKLTGSYEELCQNPVSGNFGHSVPGGVKEFAGCVCVSLPQVVKNKLAGCVHCVCVLVDRR